MLDRPSLFNYLFKETKIARMVYGEVSDNYQFYDMHGSMIGETSSNEYEKSFEEISKSFGEDEIPCLDWEDSMPYFEDGRDYLQMTYDFINLGKIQDGIYIRMISKIRVENEKV